MKKQYIFLIIALTAFTINLKAQHEKYPLEAFMAGNPCEDRKNMHLAEIPCEIFNEDSFKGKSIGECLDMIQAKYSLNYQILGRTLKNNEYFICGAVFSFKYNIFYNYDIIFCLDETEYFDPLNKLPDYTIPKDPTESQKDNQKKNIMLLRKVRDFSFFQYIIPNDDFKYEPVPKKKRK
jgi:hypothetical protein